MYCKKNPLVLLTTSLKMECKYCAHPNSRVTDKRKSPEGIRRRRECLKCKKRFTTYEKAFEHDFYITKKDKRREKFSKEKLKKGIDKAFEKRPISKDKIDSFARAVNRYPGVTHNYRRDNKYNIWFTFIAESMNEIKKNLENISKKTSVKEIMNLPATKMYKIKAHFDL